MIYYLAIILCGTLFGFGLTISGMLNPLKVQSFLNITGNWDPSLIFVMIGGILCTFIGYKIVLKKNSPQFDSNFFIPLNQVIDKKLIIGSSIFGIGWGLSGLCPGPAIGILVSHIFPCISFMITMLMGLYLGKKINNYFV